MFLNARSSFVIINFIEQSVKLSFEAKKYVIFFFDKRKSTLLYLKVINL